MNAIQKVGAISAVIFATVWVVGMKMDERLVTQVGLVCLLLSLLVFALGRMAGPSEKFPHDPRMARSGATPRAKSMTYKETR